MQRGFILIIALALPLTVHAEKGKSIMFGDTDPVYQERMIDTSEDEQAEHCKSLRRTIDSLSLRPISRNAAIQRYQLECTQNYGNPRPSIQP